MFLLIVQNDMFRYLQHNQFLNSEVLYTEAWYLQKNDIQWNGQDDEECTNNLNWPGGWFNIKIPSYQYRKSHCGDKTVVSSSYLHNGISYTGKMSSLYWIGAQQVLIKLKSNEIQCLFNGLYVAALLRKKDEMSYMSYF